MDDDFGFLSPRSNSYQGTGTSISKEWETTQYRSFRNWCNYQLAPRGIKIEDLEKEMADGLLFVALVEQISGKKLGKINQSPKFRIQKVNNIAVALDFLKGQGLRMENIGPEDIASGNTKIVAGLVWTLILHYQLAGYHGTGAGTSGSSAASSGASGGGGSGQLRGSNKATDTAAREGLLRWLQEQIGSAQTLKNFSSDWQDGRALAALVHSRNPDLMSADVIESSSPSELVELALSVLERHYEVPHIVDAQDILERPDEKSMMIFLSQLRKQLAPIPKVGSLKSNRPPFFTGTAAPNTLGALLAVHENAEEAAYSENGVQGPSWSNLVASVSNVQRALLALGVKRQDTVALIGAPSGALRIAMLAVQCAGATATTIYSAQQTAIDISLAVARSDARVLMVMAPSSTVWDTLEPRAADLDSVKALVLGPALSVPPRVPATWKVLTWDQFLGNQCSEAEGRSALASVRPTDNAVLAYSAGTTRVPSTGYFLTHQALIATAQALQTRLGLSARDRIFSHLSHANAQVQVLDIVVPTLTGAHVCYGGHLGPSDLEASLTTNAPTVVAAAPHEWQWLERNLLARHGSLSTLEARQAAGLSECRIAISVWGPLAVGTCDTFSSFGIDLRRAYGLVEACGWVALEDSCNGRESCVGSVLAHVNVKVDPASQELLVGGSVATSSLDSVILNTWLPTGDLASLDGDVLYIQGRAADRYTLASGSVVDPQEGQVALERHEFIAQALLAGHERAFSVALLTLDRAAMEPVAKSRGLTLAQLASSPLVGSSIKALVDSWNATRSREVRIRKFAILPPASSSKGELTPTYWLRRSEVIANNSKALETLWSPDTAADFSKLNSVASGQGSVWLVGPENRRTEFRDLRAMQDGVTYWTEDGNDVVRNAETIVLAGQRSFALPMDAAIVDAEEVALVNMLYANGAPVRLHSSSGELRVVARSATDLPLDEVLYTSNGVSVARTSPTSLLVDGRRVIPLEFDEDAPLPVAPGTPGTLRLKHIREEKRRSALLLLKPGDLERAEDERLARQVEEEKKQLAEQEARREAEEKRRLAVDADELALVNMLFCDGPAVTLYEDVDHRGSVRSVSNGADFPDHVTLYTENNVSVARQGGDLLVGGQRKIPLEMTLDPVSDFGSEIFQHDEAADTTATAPGTPGARRLQDVRREKIRRSSVRMAEEQERAMREAGERAAQMEIEEQERREREAREEREREAERLRVQEEHRLEGERAALAEIAVQELKAAAEREQQEQQERLAAEATAAAASAIRDETPRVLVIGSVTSVMCQALRVFLKMGAGESFELRAAYFDPSQKQSMDSQFPTLSDVQCVDWTDRGSVESCLKKVTRMLLLLPSTPLAKVPKEAEILLETARQEGVEVVTLLSVLPGGSAEMGRIEKVAMDIMEGDCCVIQTSVTCEELVTMAGCSSDGRLVVMPIAAGRLAPISSSDLGFFCATVTVRDDTEGQVIQVTGPKLVGGEDVAQVVPSEVTYDPLKAPSEAGQSLLFMDFAEPIKQGRYEIVSTEEFQKLTGTEPSAFVNWAARHAPSFSEIMTRVVLEVVPPPVVVEQQQQQQEQTAEIPDAAPRAATTTTRRLTRSGSVDLIRVREGAAPFYGNPCPVCNAYFGIARPSSPCCECNIQTCRKCVRIFESNLISPAHRHASPQVVCDRCLPGTIRHLEEAGQSSGQFDEARQEVSQLVKPARFECPPSSAEQCSVCSKEAGSSRKLADCRSCGGAACHSCCGVFEQGGAGGLLGGEDSAAIIVCERCVPALKEKVRAQAEQGEESAAAAATRALLSLDLVTIGVDAPLDTVIMCGDLADAEQERIVETGKEKCHVCDSEFGFFLRPHRCAACARLVCSKDACQGVDSDILALSRAWICLACEPLVTQELLNKGKEVPALMPMAEKEAAALRLRLEELQAKSSAEQRARDVGESSVDGGVATTAATTGDVHAADAAQPTDAGAATTTTATATTQAATTPEPSSDASAPAASTDGAATTTPAAVPATTAAAVPALNIGGASQQQLAEPCGRCQTPLSPLVQSRECSECKSAVCSSCAHHFRARVLSNKSPQPELATSRWVCERCTPDFQKKILAVGRENPKVLQQAQLESFPPRLCVAGAEFSPQDDPEYQELTAKELKAADSRGAKCFTCRSPFDVFCNPRRCGKCKKVVCTRCTARFATLGFLIGRQYGEISLCYGCWPGVKLLVQDVQQKQPQLSGELDTVLAIGDRRLAPLKPALHPLEAPLGKVIRKGKCHECSRKYGVLSGVRQCDMCSKSPCITCSGRFFVPDMDQGALVVLCMSCSGKAKEAGRIKPVSAGVKLVTAGGGGGAHAKPVSTATASDAFSPEQRSLLDRKAACSHCEKPFDAMWRRPYICPECRDGACWQCCTRALTLPLASLPPRSRVCKGCIVDVKERLVLLGGSAGADACARLDRESARLEAIDHTDENAVENPADSVDALEATVSSHSEDSPRAPVTVTGTKKQKPGFFARTFSRKFKDNERTLAATQESGAGKRTSPGRKSPRKASEGATRSGDEEEPRQVDAALTGASRSPRPPMESHASVAEGEERGEPSAAQLRVINSGAVCSSCEKEFSFLRRPYECSQCTITVCRMCSEGQILNYEEHSRNCASCVAGLKQLLDREQNHAHTFGTSELTGKCKGCHKEIGFFHPLVACSQCREHICALCQVGDGCTFCEPVKIGSPTPGSFVPDMGIPDLEVTGCGMCPEPFSWTERGMPPDLDKKGQLEYKLKYVDGALQRLDALEALLKK